MTLNNTTKGDRELKRASDSLQRSAADAVHDLHEATGDIMSAAATKATEMKDAAYAKACDAAHAVQSKTQSAERKIANARIAAADKVAHGAEQVKENANQAKREATPKPKPLGEKVQET